jgi:hypothetical protein
MNNINQEFKPIRCPVCGNVELSFVTEYHKGIGKRITCVILTAAIILLMLLNISNISANSANSFFTMTIIFLTVSDIACYIAIIIDESKTHIQAICKNCGHLWLLN